MSFIHVRVSYKINICKNTFAVIDMSCHAFDGI